MSSRLSTSAANRSREVSAPWSSSRRSSASRSRSTLSRVETDALAAARGVRKSWPTAASSAVRTLLASASGAASAAAWLSRMWSRTTAACAANAPIRRWSSACSRPPRRARTSRSAGGDLGVRFAGPGHGGTGARDRHPAAVAAFQQRDRGEGEGLPDPVQHLRQRLLAAQHAAREVRQGARLRGRARCLPGASRSQVDRRADQHRHQDEDEQSEGVVGLADGEGVQGWGEVVVEEGGTQDGGDQGRGQAAHEGHHDREQQEEEHVAHQVELAAERSQGQRQQGRQQDGEGIALQLAPGCRGCHGRGAETCPARCGCGRRCGRRCRPRRRSCWLPCRGRRCARATGDGCRRARAAWRSRHGRR